MAIDFRRAPVDILHMPAVHDGVSYIGQPPDWILRPTHAAEVRMFAASDSPDLCRRQEAMIKRQSASLPNGVIEIRSTPVVLENAKFARGLVQLNGRFWLNGASGSRVRTKYEASNTEPWRRERYLAAFRRTRAKGSAGIPCYDQDLARKLGIAIELKNGFNYYHFSTETLGSLAHYIADESGTSIRIHLPNRGEIKGFLKRFIDAVYPELADRVTLEGKATRYDKVRSVYFHQHYLYAVDDASVEEALADTSLDPRWKTIARNPSRITLTAIQSFDTSLRMLRNAALSQMRAAKLAPTPRFIWLGRDEDGDARARGISGHASLLEELTSLGFEMVAFEHLSPLEQISAMNGADIVIAPHGAGLANMIYAKPGGLIIEIGTRQTQLHRWGDFVKCAHVSQCRYHTVFADVDGIDDLSNIPPMSSGHRGVRVGRNATEQILSLVDQHLRLMQSRRTTAS